MKLVHTIHELRAELDIQRQAGKKIGLVPTMGALHEACPSCNAPMVGIARRTRFVGKTCRSRE